MNWRIFIKRDLWKDRLVVEAQAVVTLWVEGSSGDPAEITHAGQNHTDKLVEKSISALAAQSVHSTNFVAFTQLEGSDTLLGNRRYRVLSGNGSQGACSSL